MLWHDFSACSHSSQYIFSVHDIFNTLRYIHISKSSSVDNSDFVIVHVSAPYNSVGQVYGIMFLLPKRVEQIKTEEISSGAGGAKKERKKKKLYLTPNRQMYNA